MGISISTSVEEAFKISLQAFKSMQGSKNAGLLFDWTCDGLPDVGSVAIPGRLWASRKSATICI